MSDLTLVEYRVRPVTRYLVTRYEEGHNPAIEVGPKTWKASTSHGEFDSGVTAFEVAYALAGAEHQRLGWPPGDERIRYPRQEEAQPRTTTLHAACTVSAGIGDRLKLNDRGQLVEAPYGDGLVLIIEPMDPGMRADLELDRTGFYLARRSRPSDPLPRQHPDVG